MSVVHAWGTCLYAELDALAVMETSWRHAAMPAVCSASVAAPVSQKRKCAGWVLPGLRIHGTKPPDHRR